MEPDLSQRAANWDEEVELLARALPTDLARALHERTDPTELLEIVLDLGREPEARVPGREFLLADRTVTSADLEHVANNVGQFGDDNRAGIERTLHRVSAIRNRSGRITGLTMRVGRAVTGTGEIIRDIVVSGQSILLLGRPGIGKTTMLRECARLLADELRKRVVIVDTSNEIGGDGDIPHPGIGRARRMQVRTPLLQHAVMIEAVENHMPQVIVIDEIGTELEAAAARTIAERGVQLVATAHGNSLGNLLVNPTLSDLVGGIQTVTLGDEEARRRHTQKSILERKAPPTFEVVVEQQSWDEVIVHRDVADIVDSLLRGQPAMAEERTRDEETGHVSLRRTPAGAMEVPGWGAGNFGPGASIGGRQNQGFSPSTFDRNERGERRERGDRPGNNWTQIRQIEAQGSRNDGNIRGRNHVQPQMRTLAPTGTSPADIEPRSGTLVTASRPAPAPIITEGIFQAEDAQPVMSITKTLRVYPFGVNRDRLSESARHLRVPLIITNNEGEADAIITLKNYYRRQPERLQQAEQDRKLIIILKNNTVVQMQHALARIFDLPEETSPVENEQDEAATDQSSTLEFDDPTKQAMLETED